MKPSIPSGFLSISELGRETGASVRSIRHYDEHGLLTSIRTHNSYRAFPTIAITQVKQIKRMIATGLSLEEICIFPECMLMAENASSCPETLHIQQKRLMAIERQIADLEQRRKNLFRMLVEGKAPPLE